jgi:hypothetical protein
MSLAAAALLSPAISLSTWPPLNPTAQTTLSASFDTGNMDTEGTIEKAPSLQAQAVADAKARRGADDEFLAIMFEDKKMSKVYPSSDKLHKG